MSEEAVVREMETVGWISSDGTRIEIILNKTNFSLHCINLKLNY